MLHALSVVVTQTVDIILGISSLPQHDTTEIVGIEGHIDDQNILHCLSVDIISVTRCSLSSWETDEKLRLSVGASLDDSDPLGVVETSLGVVRCRAPIIVVKLDPKEIEYRGRNSHVELLVRSTALRRTGDVEGLLGVLFEVGSETGDHRSPPCPSLVVLSEVERRSTYRLSHCSQCQSRNHRPSSPGMDGGKRLLKSCMDRMNTTGSRRTR